LAKAEAASGWADRYNSTRFEEIGQASWYGDQHQGKTTASGAKFDMNQMTAAHRSLPLGSNVRVTNLDNGRSVEVLINDRGPYVGSRVIDLSREAARRLQMEREGIAPVRIEQIGGAPNRRVMN
jgi:rare lipoprotein A